MKKSSKIIILLALLVFVASSVFLLFFILRNDNYVLIENDFEKFFEYKKNILEKEVVFLGPNEEKILMMSGNISKNNSADLDEDGILEDYNLQDGVLSVYQDKKEIWKSKSDWWIDDFVLADSNNDGIIDINMSVWKSGNFGSSQPFWVEENVMSIKNHFFVFDVVEGNVKPVWQSSNLTAPNCAFDIKDVDDDGKNDLLVVEGKYENNPDCIVEYSAVWKWNGWGFSNEWRSEK